MWASIPYDFIILLHVKNIVLSDRTWKLLGKFILIE